MMSRAVGDLASRAGRRAPRAGRRIGRGYGPAMAAPEARTIEPRTRPSLALVLPPLGVKAGLCGVSGRPHRSPCVPSPEVVRRGPKGATNDRFTLVDGQQQVIGSRGHRL